MTNKTTGCCEKCSGASAWIGCGACICHRTLDTGALKEALLEIVNGHTNTSPEDCDCEIMAGMKAHTMECVFGEKNPGN